MSSSQSRDEKNNEQPPDVLAGPGEALPKLSPQEVTSQQASTEMSMNFDPTSTLSSPTRSDSASSQEAHKLINGLWNEEFDEPIDDQAALRWRRALLRLSETFLDAAEERRDLSPILLGALHNALEELLIHGNEEDLMALEDWLGHEAPPPPPIQEAVSEAARAMFSGAERRNTNDRRLGSDRRQGDRRLMAHGRRGSDSPANRPSSRPQ